MARRKRRPDSLTPGKDAFYVLTTNGAQIAVKGAAPHALNIAQRTAEMGTEPIVLTVERRSLFGPRVEIFRVTRVTTGDVFTNIVELED
jgi:hypothetical protein